MVVLLKVRSSLSQSSSEASLSEMFLDENEPNSPIVINQLMLNDPVRDLVLSKEEVELLSLRLKQWNLLEIGTETTFYRRRQDELALFLRLITRFVFAMTYVL